MKTIYFMRHGPLAGKFSDYTSLEYSVFRDLLLEKIHPSIDVEKTRAMLKDLSFLNGCQKIFCSTEKRGMQTALVVKKLGHGQITETPLLNEVQFYEGILTQEEATTYGMEGIRKTIITKWYNNQCSEMFTESIQRFRKCLEFIQRIPEEKILCITHGWFMRIIQLHAKGEDLDNLRLEVLLQEKPLGHLEYTIVTLK